MDINRPIDDKVKTCIWLLTAVMVVELGLLTTNLFFRELGLPLSRADRLTLGALFFPFYMAHVYGANWLRRQVIPPFMRLLIVSVLMTTDFIFLLGGSLGILANFSLKDQDLLSIVCLLVVLKVAPIYAECWSEQTDLLLKTPKSLLLVALKELLYFGLFVLAMVLFSSDDNARIMYVAGFIVGRASLLRLRVMLLEESVFSGNNWLRLL